MTMNTAGDLQGSHVIPHQPMLAGRKRVTEYLRKFVEADEIDTLRVLFLGAECRFLSMEILNRVETDTPKSRAANILDMAYCANAAGFVLVQGQRAELLRLTEQERQLVAALTQLGDIVDVHFLDYIIISKAGSKSIKSIFSIDRIRS
jgi:DNA repair protein RadC